MAGDLAKSMPESNQVMKAFWLEFISKVKIKLLNEVALHWTQSSA
jgi:hypothetical protein